MRLLYYSSWKQMHSDSLLLSCLARECTRATSCLKCSLTAIGGNCHLVNLLLRICLHDHFVNIDGKFDLYIIETLANKESTQAVVR